MRLHKLIFVVFVIILLSIGSTLAQAPFKVLNGILTTAQSDSARESSLHAPDTTQNTVRLIKKTYDHKQQIVLGIEMMVFIAIILTTVQSWNP